MPPNAKNNAADELIGNFTDTPAWYEKQAQAEAAIITKAAEALIGAGVGAVAVKAGGVVIESLASLRVFNKTSLSEFYRSINRRLRVLDSFKHYPCAWNKTQHLA